MNCSVLCVNEHWMKDTEIDLCVPLGYLLATSYCRKTISCGGVSIYVKSNLDLHFSLINLSMMCIEGTLEAAGMVLHTHKIVIISVYRIPGSDEIVFIEKMNALLLQLSKYKQHKIIIAGDINIDIREKRKNVADMINSLKSLNYYCLNEKPTRINACLDNIISNVHRDSVQCDVIELGLSDHAGLWLQIDNSALVTKERQITFRMLGESNVSSMKKQIKERDWSQIINTNETIDKCFSIFLTEIKNVVEQTCPIVTRRNSANTSQKPHQTNKWYTPQLNRLRIISLILKDESHKSDKDKENYINIRKLYRLEIKNSKCNANDHNILNSKNKCKAAWTVIRREINNNNKEISIPLDCDTLNQYFVNGISTPIIDSTFDAEALLTYAKLTPSEKFTWTPIILKDIQHSINKLSNSKTEDYYGLSNFIVKSIAKEIQMPLLSLSNRVLDEGTFPECLKLTVTLPVYKKGDKNLRSNYRPISIVPIISKIIENCMHKQIYKYFECHKLLNEQQFGFRSELSTVKAVESLVNNVYEGFENRLCTSGTLIDLSKAFDSVSHDIIIKKLEHYGIENEPLKLFKSYLSNRVQLVHANNQRSTILPIKRGIPQGSVLGPFIFIVYVNEFSNYIPCKSVLYADDMTLITTGENLQCVLDKNKNMMEMTSHWCQANQLCINHTKTDEIIFDLKVTKNENKTVKLLGLIIDQKLSWEGHTNYLCSKLARVLFLLYKLRDNVSKQLLLQSYFAFFHSHLQYGILLWGNSPGAECVFIWQKKAVRCILGLGRNESCRSHFKSLGIMTVPSLYIYNCLVYTKENIDKFSMKVMCMNKIQETTVSWICLSQD